MKNLAFILQTIGSSKWNQIQSGQIPMTRNCVIDLEFELQYRVFTNKGERLWHKKIYLN